MTRLLQKDATFFPANGLNILLHGHRGNPQGDRRLFLDVADLIHSTVKRGKCRGRPPAVLQ